MLKRHAFSLVELSIVLVILGLLVGGILAGQSLIRASELRAVGAEFQRFDTALKAFRDKYFAVPGDMVNATSFWGTAASCPGTASTPSTGTATCNGDGDGLMFDTVAPNANEYYRAWQHLANAGLIEGQFTGVVSGTQSLSSTAGLNVPASKLQGGGWSFYTTSAGYSPVSATSYVEGAYRNTLFFGGNMSNWITNAKILTPQEMWNLDTKMDDGIPTSGRVIEREGTPTCHTVAASSTLPTAGTGAYALNLTAVGCSPIFKTE